MGAGQPYIYNGPVTYSSLDPYNSFDPKAYTRAANATRPQARPKPQGPLIDFNKHPDSWLVTPYGQTTYKPMNPNTKIRVKRARLTQQCIRVLQFLGALGLLVCVIYIRNTKDTEGWVIRVPPAVDLLTTCYAMYHLSSSARTRPPASSASYHFFASFIDAGLVPFYVYTALVAKANLATDIPADKRWTTISDAPGATSKIVTAACLTSVVSGALHIVTFCISIYLLLMFRKISNLPPDMNPLEDNLTSRTKTKHKYKNSELGSEKDLKHMSASSGSTVSLSTSVGSSPLKEKMTSTGRPISFLHTRGSSDKLYSPHNPRTANASRTDLANSQFVYQQSPLSRASNIDLSSTENENAAARAGTPSDRSHGIYSEPSSRLSTILNPAYRGSDTSSTIPPLPRKSSKRESFPSASENWRVMDENDDVVSMLEEEDEHDGNHNNEQSVVSALSIRKIRNQPYQPLQNTHDNPEYKTYFKMQNSPSHKPVVRQSPPLDAETHDAVFVLQPLGMNPPTPPPSSLRTTRRVLTPTSGNSNVDSGSSLSNGGKPTSGKKKYYGDLKDAYQGIRNTDSSRQSPSNKQFKKHESGLPVSDWIIGSRQGVAEKDFADANVRGIQRSDGQGRVISRTGIDITEAPYADDAESDMLAMPGGGYAGMGNRQVSGKMAEEGYAGVGSKGWKGSFPRRRISGRLGWRSGY